MVAPLKTFLGRVPKAADLYDAVRPQRPRTRYNLEQLRLRLPEALQDLQSTLARGGTGKRLVLFASLHYWIEQAVMLGLILRAMGHDVTMVYLPYSTWEKDINTFDLRRQDLYTRRVLKTLEGTLEIVSLLDCPPAAALPAQLEEAVERTSSYDCMYSLQVEDVDRTSALYRLRLERNRSACLAALRYLKENAGASVLVPNGLVTELGVFYEAARYLGLDAVTYEFNDQREQIWLAQNDVVMRQNTDALWQARSQIELTAEQRAQLEAFEAARRGGGTYGKGTRNWQDISAEGGVELRRRLGLDGRPILLLATNVLGDSLTLGRHLFAGSMAEWIEQTVRHFAARPEVQLIIRVHPGERLMKGPSMVGVIERALNRQAEHIHVIGPTEKVNTYDLMDIADLGLVYTTTVGLEMALRGVPVIIAGATHYRGRGFTQDPSTWEEYWGTLEAATSWNRQRLSAGKIQQAWNYAYRFFFEFPFSFPWRLMHLWRDIDDWPLKRVLGPEGQSAFGRAFAYLAGEPIQW